MNQANGWRKRQIQTHTIASVSVVKLYRDHDGIVIMSECANELMQPLTPLSRQVIRNLAARHGADPVEFAWALEDKHNQMRKK